MTAEDPGEELKQILLEQETWVPVLRVGSEIVLDRAFDEGCELRDARQVLEALHQVGGSVSGGFGAAFGVLTGSFAGVGNTTASAMPTAQWLEYVIRVPGLDDRTIRRQVFDVIGPARRAAGSFLPDFSETQDLTWRLALLGETEILPLATQISQPYVEYVSAQRLLAQKDVLIALVQHPDPQTLRELEDRAARLEPVPSNLYALAVGRAGWRAETWGHLDRLNLLSQHVSSTRTGPAISSGSTDSAT